jgi:hypothetical protein
MAMIQVSIDYPGYLAYCQQIQQKPFLEEKGKTYISGPLAGKQWVTVTQAARPGSLPRFTQIPASLLQEVK